MGFPLILGNVGLWLVVCRVEDYVTEFAFVHELTAFWAPIDVLLFFWRKLLVFVGCHPRTTTHSLRLAIVKLDHALNIASRIENANLLHFLLIS
jgi:hypothetical protein